MKKYAKENRNHVVFLNVLSTRSLFALNFRCLELKREFSNFQQDLA